MKLQMQTSLMKLWKFTKICCYLEYVKLADFGAVTEIYPNKAAL